MPGRGSFIKKYQCDRAQGFYYAKPAPADMLTNLFAKNISKACVLTPTKQEKHK